MLDPKCLVVVLSYVFVLPGCETQFETCAVPPYIEWWNVRVLIRLVSAR